MARQRQWLAVIVGVIALGGLAFAAARQFAFDAQVGATPDGAGPHAADTTSGTALADDPTPDFTTTPSADATPDQSQPFWYVPYLNRERDAPKFSGVVNGYRVGSDGPHVADEWSTICESPHAETGADAEARWKDSPISFDGDDLPPGMKLFNRPIYTICPDIGVVALEATVRVQDESGEQAPGSGAITVRRSVGRASAGIEASAARWSEATVAGWPAAVLRPVIENVGDTAMIVHDEERNVTTLLYGGGVYLEDLEALAEEILR